MGVSLNMSRILTLKGVADRALEALVLLVAILLTSSLALVPGQPRTALGLEIIAVGGVTWGTVSVLELRTLRASEAIYRKWYVRNLAMGQVAVVPYVIGGVITAGFSLDGLYVVVLSIVVSFTDAILDAWVLLVEINR